MSVVIESIGGMKYKVVCRAHTLISDQPLDEGGDDEGMAPVELLIASLGTCIGFFISQFCERHKIKTGGMKINLSWEKASKPTRISKIVAEVIMPSNIPERLRNAVTKVAERCVVTNTLMYPTEIDIIARF